MRGAVASRNVPLLVGGVVTGPDLDLGAGSAVAGVVQALAGVGVDQFSVGLVYPGLRAGTVTRVVVHGGAVGRAGPGHVEAAAEHLQGAVGLDRPALRVGAVAGVNLDRVEVGRAGAAVIQAQSFVAGDGAGGGWGAAAGAAGLVGGDVGDAHGAAGGG